ncbi:MAG: hypothetical protein F4X26_04075 [Chloroflexi bacterium]|nr:hypothetical protein [Chloroflexota bacterium]MYD65152.1 hypothetical protein [Chloroflexota bacterium]
MGQRISVRYSASPRRLAGELEHAADNGGYCERLDQEGTVQIATRDEVARPLTERCNSRLVRLLSHVLRPASMVAF